MGETLLLATAGLVVAAISLPLLLLLIARVWEWLALIQEARAADRRQAIAEQWAARRAISQARQEADGHAAVHTDAPKMRQPVPPAVVVRSTCQIPRPADLPAALLVRRHAPIMVRPVANLPLWQEKGWRQVRPGVVVGEFQAAGRRWRGQIEMPYRGAYQAFIWQPPLRELDLHPHRACFQRNGHGPDCYHVHYGQMPSSLDHAITTVETVLAEAVTRYRGRA